MNLKKNKINESLKPNWIIEFIIAIKFQLERWLSSHSKGTTLAFMLRWLFFESAGSYFRQKVNSVENWKKWWEKKLNEAWFEIFCCCYDGHTFGGHRKWKWRQFFMKIYFYYVAHLGKKNLFLFLQKKIAKSLCLQNSEIQNWDVWKTLVLPWWIIYLLSSEYMFELQM